MNELKIESIEQLYHKHKVFGIKQFMKNKLSRNTLIYLSKYYINCEIPKESFVSQLYNVKANVHMSPLELKTVIERIDGRHQCNDINLRLAVSNIIKNYDINFSYVFVKQLNICLYAEFT